MVAVVVRPIKELKDFQKVKLQLGESKQLLFAITKEKLLFYDKQLSLVAEPGDFIIMIESASDDIKFKQKLF